jgi:hypothetical protein
MSPHRKTGEGTVVELGEFRWYRIKGDRAVLKNVAGLRRRSSWVAR